MDDFNVIIRPLITEQGMHFANVKGAYSFQVNKKAKQGGNQEGRGEDLRCQSGQSAHGQPQGQAPSQRQDLRRNLELEEGRGVLEPEFHIDLF